MRSVVVTGVSTGIGKGIAEVLIGKGQRVFGSVRRQVDADRLQQEFGDRFSPLIFDVTDAAAVTSAAEIVRKSLAGARLAGLVNNAGIAVSGPLLELRADELRRQLEINLVAPLTVTQAFAALLGMDAALTGPPGRIVNISSVTGRSGLPFVGAYAASKHGLEGLSESLRRELLQFGIDVIIVAPGTVATPIWDKGEQVDWDRYRASPYLEALHRSREMFVDLGRNALPPERIGEIVHQALTVSRPKTRYAPVKGKLFNWTLPQSLPRRVVDRLVCRRFGLLP